MNNNRGTKITQVSFTARIINVPAFSRPYYRLISLDEKITSKKKRVDWLKIFSKFDNKSIVRVTVEEIGKGPLLRVENMMVTRNGQGEILLEGQNENKKS